MKRFISIILLFCTILGLTIAQHAIIPIPVSTEWKNGSFELKDGITICTKLVSQDSKFLVKSLQSALASRGITSKVSSDCPKNNFILLVIDSEKSDLSKEGYQLVVSQQNITVQAQTEAGLFYGIQSLEQLIPIEGSVILPAVEITDHPRFAWRGLMLDVSRHFFSVADVKRFIDRMADYKFNVFHWHLTDDEGWRIEIKSLPELTSKGAWRVERHGRFGEYRSLPKEGEKASYGGFYTQEEIKEVVAYASQRHISIVPEIDMPGHSMALLAAYPHLSVNKKPSFVNPGSKFSEWYEDGTFKMLIENTLNPCDERVYDVIEKVMTEVAALFPSQYIHMGGDECYKGFWEENKDVQDFMKANNIHDSHELQSYFVKRVEKIIRSKGKTMIGWDEILEGGLAEGALVMSWRGMKGGIEAAKLGHKVIMAPTTFAYLDYTQGDRSVETNIYADLYLEKCYQFEPLPEGVDPSLILGGQANLWTEAIPNMDYAMYMTYPRALAIAECVWSPSSQKNWKNFLSRTESHFHRFDNDKEHISKAIFDPVVSVKKESNLYRISLTSIVDNCSIHYSIDNTYPLHNSLKYKESFLLPDGDYFLRTQLYRDGKPLGRMLQIHRSDLIKRAK